MCWRFGGLTRAFSVVTQGQTSAARENKTRDQARSSDEAKPVGSPQWFSKWLLPSLMSNVSQTNLNVQDTSMYRTKFCPDDSLPHTRLLRGGRRSDAEVQSSFTFSWEIVLYVLGGPPFVSNEQGPWIAKGCPTNFCPVQAVRVGN